MGNVLVISPHADDEVYGAFSYLKDSVVCIVGINESALSNRPSRKERIREVRDVEKFTEARYIIQNYPVNEFDCYPTDIITDLEDIIKEIKPDTVLIPYPSMNKDHVTVYEASVVALRKHDVIPWVPNVLMYECPQSFVNSPMPVNCFRKVDIDKKLEAYRLYETQIRQYRSEETIKTMAKMRGQQGGYYCAEGFRVVRLCLE